MQTNLKKAIPASNFAQQVNSWIAMHDPKTGPGRRMPRPKALLATPDERAAAAAVVTGSGASADVAASKKLKTLATSSPEEAKADFRNRPMDGCTSLMNLARVKANFNPAMGMTPANVAAFADYVERVLACPLFNVDMSDHQKISRSSDNWDELISAVADTFEGVEAGDKDKIRTSVTNLVKAAASNSNTDESTDLFVQSVINSSNNIYDIYIYSSHVHLVDDKSKHHESMQEDFEVSRAKLSFRTADWPHFSDAVWDKQWTAVDDWLNGNTTPSSNATALKTCL
ncbi:MAG: hypothetical protein WDN46_00930 [Methylocella sp.]